MNEQECLDHVKTMQGEIDRLQENYDKKCDEYLELILINAEMRKLLNENNIENDL